MKAVVLTVGDEILIGQIINSNASWISEKLADLGIRSIWHLSVADEQAAIIEGIKLGFEKADIILITGGLGPTKDDITKNALATFYGCELQFSEETFENIQSMFTRRGIPMTDAHREQCFLPDQATLLPNKMGTAPGMWFNSNEKYLVSMPGVPYEMKYLMTHGVIPKLIQLERMVYRKKTIRTAGIGETSLADMIEPILQHHDVSVAYLPSVGQVRLRISKMGSDSETVERAIENAVNDTTKVIESYLYGYDDEQLESHVGQLLMAQNKSIGTAESCSGGYLAYLITSVAGASQYFKGSIVAYSNAMKEALLNVSTQALDSHGAVSESVVQEMVQGALNALQCDVAVAISGVAGPTGGSEDKPVGTVWIAVGDRQSTICEKFLFTKDRIINIKYTAIYALVMVRKFLIGR